MSTTERFKFRRDTEANWESVNPVLLEGEIAYTVDGDGNYVNEKFGDGVTPWSDLPYKSVDGTNLVDGTVTEDKLSEEVVNKLNNSGSGGEPFSGSASDVTFNPAGTGLSATNVQEAIAEVKEAVDNAVVDGGGTVVVQTIGNSTASAMSQKAVSDALLDVIIINDKITLESGNRLSQRIYLGKNRKNIKINLTVLEGGSGPSSAVVYTDGTNVSLGNIAFNGTKFIDSVDYDNITIFAQTFTERTIIEYVVTFDNLSSKVENLIHVTDALTHEIDGINDISYSEEVDKIEDDTFFNGKYFNTNATNISKPAVLESVSCMKIPCTAGDNFKIYAVAGASTAVQLYGFTRSDDSIIEKSSYNTITDLTDTGLEVVAPSGAVSMFVNMSQYASKGGRVEKISSVTKKEVVKLVESKERENHLKGKTIVCFGDSITETYDIHGKRYSDYLADYTGANVVNVGVGGTRIEKRKELTITPSNSNDAYAALDVISLVNAVVDQSFDMQYAAVNSGHISMEKYKPIVDRLVNIDFSTVDAVTIFAGTNSWRNARVIGSTGQKDESYTLGAINLIIERLLTKYPNIKLYWFTPMVRWIDNDGFSEATWSDNYSLDGYLPDQKSLTLKQFKEVMKEEIVKNHLPVCDLYDSLGINLYNFWHYFPNINLGDSKTDGTHPLKGMDVLARKISSYLTSNLLF